MQESFRFGSLSLQKLLSVDTLVTLSLTIFLYILMKR